MSDGPHRSLPMRKPYKRVAEWADNTNFEVVQVANALSQAVLGDVRKEVPADVVALIRRHFVEGEGDLFPDQRLQDLLNGKTVAAGSPLGSVLFDCALKEFGDGNLGREGIEVAIGSALLERMLRAARQIEEHYLRRSSPTRTTRLRGRLEQAIGELSLKVLARQVLRDGSGHATSRVRHDGLDDGVPL